MIKAIVCDGDGMLINGERFSDYLAREYGIVLDKTASFFAGEFQDCLVGKADLKTIVPKYFEAWGWKKSVEEFLKEWFESERHIDKDLLGYLNVLRSRGIKVYLATNQEQYRTQYVLEDMGFRDMLDGIFSSARIGYKKPRKEFFEEMMRRLQGIENEEVLFWDDQQTRVDGAREFGLNAELYTTLDDFKSKIGKYI